MTEHPERSTTVRLGRTDDGMTVYAVVTIRPDRPTPSPHQTTEHEHAETCTEVSVIHETYRPGRRPADHDGPPYLTRHEPDSLGASRDPFREVTETPRSEPAASLADTTSTVGSGCAWARCRTPVLSSGTR